MPIEKRQNHEGEIVTRYVVPFVVRTMDVDASDLDIVKDHRREYAGQVELLHKMQKQFGSEKNYEAAKGCKEIIKHFTQAEKCATLVINWFERATDLNTADFPQELYEFLDYEFNSIEIYRDQMHTAYAEPLYRSDKDA
ncbi:hypothetical protein D3C87_587900 [compost metagenome]